MDAFDVVRQCKDTVRRVAEEEVLPDGNSLFRAQLRLNIRMKRVRAGEVVSEEDKWISSSLEEMDGFEDWWNGQVLACEKTCDFLNTNGSGWIIDCINFLDFCIARGDRVRYYVGRSSNFALPEALKQKQAVINPPSNGDNCFLYACIAVLHHGEEVLRKSPLALSSYRPWLHELNLDGVALPVSLHSLDIIERQNPSICFTVLTWCAGKVEVLRQCKAKTAAGRCVLPLLYLVDEKTQKTHWCAVVSLNRLLNSRDGLHQRKWCERCLSAFRSEERLQQHRLDCYQSDDYVIREILPTDDNNELKFCNWQKTISPAFVAYADAESFNATPEEDEPTASVRKLSQHLPAALGYLLVQREGTTGPALRSREESLKLFKDDDPESCVEKFLCSLDETAREIYQWNREYGYQRKIMDADSRREFNDAQNCYYCNYQFASSQEKNWDHNYLNGLFRGAACTDCNLKAQLNRRFLPVYFHSLGSYDLHLIFSTALHKMTHWKLSVIPKTNERYLTLKAEFQVGEVTLPSGQKRRLNFTIQFLDSLNFLGCSLEKVMRTLNASSCPLTLEMKQKRPLLSEDILLAKGVFPYDFAKQPANLLVTKLPPQDAFFNILTQTSCSDAEYNHAKRAWQESQVSNLGEYMMLYLEMDIRQLADAFESFRRLSLADDGLDPVHFVTAPGLSYESALKSAKYGIQLLTDGDMYRMFEGGIRGGMTFTNVHKVRSSSNEDDSSYLLPLDVNNLYGQALSMYLPVSDFRWVERDELCNWNEDTVLNLPDDGPHAYLIEADLHYPDSLHELTEELPLAPEKGSVVFDEFPEFMKQLWHQLNPEKNYATSQKLLLTCYDKKAYIAHSRILKFYLKMGIKISQFRRAIQFKQEPIFKEYIDRNSAKRSQVNSEFEKNYYKSKNNSLFGKTMENVRKRRDIRICNSEHQAEILASKPNLKEFTIIKENLSIFQLGKTSVRLDRPVYIGQCVLDLSKLIMYQLFYEQLKPRFESPSNKNARIHLLGGDTDSLFLCVKNIDVPRYMLPALVEQGLLDTSNYPPQHPLHSVKLKARLGCVKDESAGSVYEEWILLKPKLYSFKSAQQSTLADKKAAKGVQKAVVKSSITHDDYDAAFQSLNQLSVTVRRISSNHHRVFTLEQEKKALSVWEDKRAWISANVSLPFGHVNLRRRGVCPATSRKRSLTPPILGESENAKQARSA